MDCIKRVLPKYYKQKCLYCDEFLTRRNSISHFKNKHSNEDKNLYYMYFITGKAELIKCICGCNEYLEPKLPFSVSVIKYQHHCRVDNRDCPWCDIKITPASAKKHFQKFHSDKDYILYSRYICRKSFEPKYCLCGCGEIIEPDLQFRNKTKYKLSHSPNNPFKNKEFLEKLWPFEKRSEKSAKQKPKWLSKPEKIILNYLKENFNEKIESQKFVLKRYRVDIFIPNKNLIIEIYGCYWHGCNKQHGKRMFKTCRGVPIEEVRKKNELRIKELQQHYNTLIVWEHDIINSDNYKQILINNIYGNK